MKNILVCLFGLALAACGSMPEGMTSPPDATPDDAQLVSDASPTGDAADATPTDTVTADAATVSEDAGPADNQVSDAAPSSEDAAPIPTDTNVADAASMEDAVPVPDVNVTDTVLPTDASDAAVTDASDASDAAPDATPDASVPTNQFWIYEIGSPGGILVAGQDRWDVVGNFQAGVNGTEAGLMERVRIELPFEFCSFGDAAIFDSVRLVHRVGSTETVVATGVPTRTGCGAAADLLLPEPVRLEPSITDSFRIDVRIARLSSHAALGYRYANGPFSGSRFMALVSNGYVGGDWSSEYAPTADLAGSKVNIRVHGATSGQLLLAEPRGHGGYYYRVHASVPVLTSLPLSTTYLAPGVASLARFQVAVNGPQVALRRLTFRIERALTLGSSYQLTNFRILRGTSLVPMGTVRTHLVSGAPDISSRTQDDLVVDFVNAEILTGSGQSYTLQADVTGSMGLGEYLTVRILDDRIGGTTMGSLTFTYRTGSGGPLAVYGAPFIDVAPEHPEFAVYDGPAIWSDMSEPDHSDSTQDWINGNFLSSVGLPWLLTR